MQIKSDNRKNRLKEGVVRLAAGFTRIMERRGMQYVGLLSMYVFSFLVWFYISGFVGFFLGLFASLQAFRLIFNPFMTEDEFYFGVVFIFIAFLLSTTANIKSHDIVKKQLVIDKYEFVESTEKLVLSVREPFKRVIVIDSLSSEDFFTMRLNDEETITAVIEKEQSYDHIDKWFYDSEHSITKYKIVFLISNMKKEVRCCACDDKLFITNECDCNTQLF